MISLSLEKLIKNALLKKGTIKTIKLILKLGFIIHPEKSTLQHSQEIAYLGFVFNSKEILVTPTTEKMEKF